MQPDTSEARRMRVRSNAIKRAAATVILAIDDLHPHDRLVALNAVLERELERGGTKPVDTTRSA
jgi:hypothetical protein